MRPSWERNQDLHPAPDPPALTSTEPPAPDVAEPAAGRADGVPLSVPRSARPYQGQRAGVVSRLLAAATDGVIVLAAVLVLYAAYAGVVFLFDPVRFSFPRAQADNLLGESGLLLAAYLTVSWSTTGRTYGQLLLGLRVLGAHRPRPRTVVALARAVFYVLFPVGLLWCAVSRTHRSVQDIVLRTTVVYDWAEHPGRPDTGAAR